MTTTVSDLTAAPPDPPVPEPPPPKLPIPPESLVDAVARIEAFVLDGPDLLADAQLLAASRTLQRLTALVGAAELRVVHAMETRQAAESTAGCPTSAWLRESHRLTARQAPATVRRAAEFAAHPLVGAALADGSASLEQCRGIIIGIAGLPEEMSDTTRLEVEQVLVGYVDRFDPDELRRLARHAFEVVAPDLADDLLRKQLEREQAEAQKRRRLTWSRDGHGSVFFRVKLPTLEAEELLTQINAYVANAQRLDEADSEGADPGYQPPTLDQRRADALMRLVEDSEAAGRAPLYGGDRPRITALVDLAALLSRMGGGESQDSGEHISPGDIRRMACDCDLLPAAFGGPSQLLDVGRTMRLVTGDLRQAVHLRDRGCTFPGCDRPPRVCEAHHIVPWVDGGPTAMTNLALLCRHHHALVEPDPRSVPGARWEVRMGADGIPEFLPPARAVTGGVRHPLRHARYSLLDPENSGSVAA